MYDIIGDIHGHATELKLLLEKMDYKKVDGVWQHQNRKAIFLGDYIDRGPEIRETLQIVKKMVETGNAIALMGNHEYNALAYHYKTPGGDYLRPQEPKNVTQHSQTLAQFYFHQDELQHYLQWFYTLPLFIKFSGLRAVHACWDDEHINWLINNYPATEKITLRQAPRNKRDKQGDTVPEAQDGIDCCFLTEKLMVKAHVKKSKEYRIIEDILKGKEANIGEQNAWKDKDGHLRTENRIKWWKYPLEVSAGEFLFDCPKKRKHQAYPTKIKVNVYPADAPPVFIGHYWLKNKKPKAQSSNVICLDYSVAKGGSLVAYRFNGEQTANKKNFVTVPAQNKWNRKKYTLLNVYCITLLQ